MTIDKMNNKAKGGAATGLVGGKSRPNNKK